MNIKVSKDLIQISFVWTLCLVCSSCQMENKQQSQTLIPVITSEYIHVYDPKGDVFSGPDTEDLKAGQYYKRWQTNDHCFVKGPDKRWHSFGITRPVNQPGERVKHSGEYTSFHAVSPGDMFEYSFCEEAWKDTTKVLPPSQRPGETTANHAPTIVKHAGIYKMIYGPIPFRMAVSNDMYNWEPKGPLAINEKNGRDPGLMLWEDTYYLTYCSGNVIKTTTSKDLETWSEPVEIYKGGVESYQCESPTLLRYNNTFSGVCGIVALPATVMESVLLFIVLIIHWIFTISSLLQNWQHMPLKLLKAKTPVAGIFPVPNTLAVE